MQENPLNLVAEKKKIAMMKNNQYNTFVACKPNQNPCADFCVKAEHFG